MPKTRFQLVIEPKLLKLIKRLRNKKRESISQYIVKLIESDLSNRGIQLPD